MPFATERKRAKDRDLYQNLINIIHVASYHPEKGTNKQVDVLYKSYNDADQSYTTAKFDPNALAALKARSAQVQAVRKAQTS